MTPVNALSNSKHRHPRLSSWSSPRPMPVLTLLVSRLVLCSSPLSLSRLELNHSAHPFVSEPLPREYAQTLPPFSASTNQRGQRRASRVTEEPGGKVKGEKNSPLRALLVQHPARAVRARHQRILAERHAAAAVAAQVRHGRAAAARSRGVRVVRRAASAGGGARARGDLVLFARHVSLLCAD